MKRKNLIFEGDNLSIMKSGLFKKHVRQVDMIYIDPPYNTGNSFSYDDSKSTEDWNKFIEDRLLVSKEYMKDGAPIFISIDDSKYANLKLICDEVFGAENFVGTFITQQAIRSNAKHINICHEYILCFTNNIKKLKPFKLKRINIPQDRHMINDIAEKVKSIFKKDGKEAAEKELKTHIEYYCKERNITWLKNYSNVDENGDVFFAKDLSTPGKPREVDIPEIGLKLSPLQTRGWSSDAKFISLHMQKKLVFKNERPYEKHLLVDSEDNACSLLNYYSRQGTNDLNKLGLRNLFDTPKPVELIKFLIRIGMSDNGVLLDFFAGSGTSAQSIYECNKEDGGNKGYVLIQLNEEVNKDTKVYDACKKYGIKPLISEITVHRINTYLQKEGMEIDYEVMRG